MPSNEAYPCYVRIGNATRRNKTKDLVELPTENDGTMLLSTITAQFEDAIGLRYQSESGAWRGLRVADGVLDKPLEGWGDTEYIITLPKTDRERKRDHKAEDADGPAVKRKVDDDSGPADKKKTSEKEMLSDLICLGLPYTLGDEEFKTYFEKFGELEMYSIKSDPTTKKSRGFGFIRYKTVEAAAAVLGAKHEVGGRKCEVRFPKKESQSNPEDLNNDGDDIPTKLFIGRLPGGTTVDDLREYFSGYGPLKDVYIPTNFRGFGFVTFATQEAAGEVMNRSHVIKDKEVNISYPAPKAGEQPQQMVMEQQQQQSYGYDNMQGSRQGGNMESGTQSEYMQGGRQGGNMESGTQSEYMQGGRQGGNMQGGTQSEYMQGSRQGGNMQGGNMESDTQGRYMQGGRQGGNMESGTQSEYMQGGRQGGNMQSDMESGRQGGYMEGGRQGGNTQGATQSEYTQGGRLGGNMQSGNMESGTQGGYMQGGRQGGNMQSGNMQGPGYGNNMNNSQQTSGYYQHTGKVQGGK